MFSAGIEVEHWLKWFNKLIIRRGLARFKNYWLQGRRIRRGSL